MNTKNNPITSLFFKVPAVNDGALFTHGKASLFHHGHLVKLNKLNLPHCYHPFTHKEEQRVHLSFIILIYTND